MVAGGIEVFDNQIPEVVILKERIIQELLPDIKLDSYRYSLDFIILPLGGLANE